MAASLAECVTSLASGPRFLLSTTRVITVSNKPKHQ